MLVKENITLKKNLSYPVFAKYKSTGEIYMFLSESESVIIKHDDPTSVFTYAGDTLPVSSSDWEILPDGYSITLTQNQQG